MSTTTIRIENELKVRVAAAAQRAGKTVPWDDAKAYLAARANGEPTRKPAARRWAK